MAWLGEDDDLADQPRKLVEFRRAKLFYPSLMDATTDDESAIATLTTTTRLSSSPTVVVDLSILDPTSTRGGHALLGRNAMGKSLIGQAIVARGYHKSDNGKGVVIQGEWELPPHWGSESIQTDTTSGEVAHVSFDSHQALLQEGGTTFKAIASGAGRLNKAAQFLIVRFGLYGLLSRTVDTLSTGEIRKTLLVKALSQRPKLLILDNAFDGLDVASREVLKQMVQKTITGFTQDILVQGVNSKATAQTQILMMTHRPEELVDAIQYITYWVPQDDDDDDEKRNGMLMTTESRNGRSGIELFGAALNLEPGSMVSYDWEDEHVPSMDTIAAWWKRRRDDTNDEDSTSFSAKEPIISTHNLSIHRGDATLLHDLNWSVARGERWLVGGDNGAGKSTLSRLLVRPDQYNQQQLKINGSVGWVSTERHIEMAKSKNTVQQILPTNQTGEASIECTKEVATWLGVADIMDRPFGCLSQGQQKLVLIGAALACKPDLLVLDEPCQGLDAIGRQLVLVLVERICRATDMSLVYITHHMEELLPSVSHALHLKDKRAVFQGPIKEYNPKDL
jgi:molybdate transport system ATP-binding protein